MSAGKSVSGESQCIYVKTPHFALHQTFPAKRAISRAGIPAEKAGFRPIYRCPPARIGWG
jgi:hypothetical protein